ncbi:MAG: undecaprenyl-diphosphate phosphatase [Bacteroides sp.]|nr:undecaprenyl-diphosphate phosphatase [Eubacterium sp.]MCM1418278.1 undecaprenyl-diphosphate phosphatase [Roseburia sp.]MCM1462339.1 undecaprenyl-diphosphate phosphatase [Bacteroides sp.]
MEIFSIIIQGIIQGLTEFLPVSSSGHLSVVQHFLNVGEESLMISIVLHLGTLLAVFLAFWSTIAGMIKEFFLTIRDIFTGRFSWREMNDDRRMMFMVIFATLILVPVYFFKDFFTSVEGDGDIIFEGCAFLFTAILLFLSDACVKGAKTGKDMTVGDAVTVGLFQCVALFPGVSRSGSTVTAGLFCGLTRETAVTYSFILGIPAILGGSILEIGDAAASGESFDLLLFGIGFLTAAIVGFLSIKLVHLIIKHDKFKIFGIYTLVLGILCIGVGVYELLSGNHLSIS